MDMIDQSIQQEIDRFAELERKIRTINDYSNLKDLLRLARSCENIINDISRERVNCRRLRRETNRLSELYTHLCEANTTLDQYITFATLLDH